MHYNVGKVLTDAGLDEQGEAVYKEAIRYILHLLVHSGCWVLIVTVLCRLYPEYDQALNNLGNLVKVGKQLFLLCD